MAVTDNDVIYDNILTPTELELIVAEADHFDEPEKFVAIPAYERTYRKERKKGPNHRIMLFLKGHCHCITLLSQMPIRLKSGPL